MLQLFTAHSGIGSRIHLLLGQQETGSGKGNQQGFHNGPG